MSDLEKLVEELHVERKQLSEEVAHLRETLAAKDEAHELHLRAYQDTHERQEEQLTLLEARVRTRRSKWLQQFLGILQKFRRTIFKISQSFSMGVWT